MRCLVFIVHVKPCTVTAKLECLRQASLLACETTQGFANCNARAEEEFIWLQQPGMHKVQCFAGHYGLAVGRGQKLLLNNLSDLLSCSDGT